MTGYVCDRGQGGDFDAPAGDVIAGVTICTSGSSVDWNGAVIYQMWTGHAISGPEPTGMGYCASNTQTVLGYAVIDQWVVPYTQYSYEEWISDVVAEWDFVPSPFVIPDDDLGGGNPAGSPHTGCACDPVQTATGNLVESSTDISAGGRGGGLSFTRTWNTAMRLLPWPETGNGWVNNLDMNICSRSWLGFTYAMVRQENGSIVPFLQSGSSYVAPSWASATLVHHSGGTWTYVRKHQQTFNFNAPITPHCSTLVSTTDLNGNTITLTRSSSDELLSASDGNGRTLTFHHASSGVIDKITDNTGRFVSYTYGGGTWGRNLQTMTNPSGDVTTYGWDNRGRITSITDPLGTVSNTYGSTGSVNAYRVMSQTDRRGHTSTFSYNPTPSVGDWQTTITDARGLARVDTYLGGFLISSTQGAGTADAATVGYSFNSDETLASKTLPDGNSFFYSYSGGVDGKPTSITDPAGRTTTIAYNTLGEPTSVTSPNGVTTTSTYDSAGNLLTSATPLAGPSSSPSNTATTTYHHASGAHPEDVTSVDDPSGRTSTFTYDAAGDLLSVTDAGGDTTSYTYNGIGWVSSTLDGRGHDTGAVVADHTTTYTRDDLGRPLTITDPLGHVSTFTYDAHGNVLTATDADGHTTTSTYDANDDLLTATMPDASVVTSTYDNDGNLLAYADENGHATSYTYDALNRLATRIDPDANTYAYTYDPATDSATVTDPSGRVETIGTNPDGQTTSVTYSVGGTPTIGSVSFDSDGNRTSIHDGTGTTTRSYDAQDQVISSTDGNGATVGYTYDKAGRQTSITYPSGRVVTYGYDTAGRLATIADGSSNTSTLAYDSSGNLTGISRPAGISSAYTYDNANQGASLANTAGSTNLLTTAITRNDVGQITASTETGSSAGSRAYTYSSKHQLTNDSGRTLGYDPTGNPTTVPDPSTGTASTLTFDNADQLTGLTPASGPATSFTSDLEGDRTSSTVSSATTGYAYNQNHELTTFTPPTGSATTYTYDAGGIRESSTTASTTRHYTWTHNGGLPDLLSDGTNEYIYGLGQAPLEQINISTGALTWLLTDALGSVRTTTNASGTTTGSATYTPTGAPTAGSNTATVTPFGFAGALTDPTGLVYLRARDYDPQTAQFLTRDPLEDQTREPYAYAGDDPANASDPSGLDWIDDAANAFEGAADTASFGATKWVRHHIGLGDAVNECSDAYRGGGYGAMAAMMFDGEGELALGGRATEDVASIVYRTGSRTDDALTDASGVSFRDSLSSSASSTHPQVFRPGDKVWGVDSSKLPRGSLIRDGVPPGHVTIRATPAEIRAAIVRASSLQDLGLKELEDFGAFRIPK